MVISVCGESRRCSVQHAGMMWLRKVIRRSCIHYYNSHTGPSTESGHFGLKARWHCRCAFGDITALVSTRPRAFHLYGIRWGVTWQRYVHSLSACMRVSETYYSELMSTVYVSLHLRLELRSPAPKTIYVEYLMMFKVKYIRGKYI